MHIQIAPVPPRARSWSGCPRAISRTRRSAGSPAPTSASPASTCSPGASTTSANSAGRRTAR